MTERNEPGDENERRGAEEDERRTSEAGARRPRRRREHREEGGDDPRRRREHREEGGDDPLRHARILQHRWEGSPPPTAERYARALQQWRALPGAVVSPGTGMTARADETGPDEGSQS